MDLMKRVVLVLGIAVLIVLSIVGIAVASESYVISDYSGASMNGRTTIVDSNSNWTSAPKDPNVVYIAVWAPKPYQVYIEDALVKVVRERGLKPVLVGNVTMYDLRGRFVMFYSPMVGHGGSVLYRMVSLSGILYYSYAGDAKSAVDTINHGLEFSESAISKSSEKFCQASMNRLMKLKVANQTCGVAYWWNLRAKVGKLSRANPYEMIANEIASQLDQFLTSS
ncbi:hypothetical protein [Thermococcus henrietii]|uniref:hypothetical protein n=1 Tax=Thermococcus henrietii TaxID=2016361 RepID=UPI0011AB3CD5|nr:hypothetical protein [Thermococcus henrietii]